AVPGGFGPRGMDGNSEAIRYARGNKLPFLGVCLGLDLAAVEFARDVLGIHHADPLQGDPNTKAAGVQLVSENNQSHDGTMKSAAYRVCIKPDTKASTAYDEETVFERHRHRFAVNPAYETSFAEKGFIVSAYGEAESEIKVMELTDHPWFVACQYHPEFK